MSDEQQKAALPRHIEDAIKQISNLQRAHYSEARPSERVTDRAVSIIGTPTFFAVLGFLAAAWMVLNLAGDRAIDPPPFAFLEVACSLIAILLAVLILAAQRRDDRLATRREQMALQVSLLTEQKVSKLIELVEELRRDLPNVHDRVDLDAIEMTAPSNHEETLRSVDEASKPGGDQI
jgi:uncharacterized membrane protein